MAPRAKLSQQLMRMRVAASGDKENIHFPEDNHFPSEEQRAEEELTPEEPRTDVHKQLFHLSHLKEDNLQGIDQQSAVHCIRQLSEEEQTIGTDNEVRHYLQGNNSQSEVTLTGIGQYRNLPTTDIISSTTGVQLLDTSIGEIVSDLRGEGEELLIIESIDVDSAIEPSTLKNPTVFKEYERQEEEQEEIVEDADNNASPPNDSQKEHTTGVFTASVQAGKTNWFNEEPAEMVHERDIPQITEEGLHGVMTPNICSCEEWTETQEIESDLTQSAVYASTHGKEEPSQLDVPVPGATEEVELACISQEYYSNIDTETIDKHEKDASCIEMLSTDSKANHITVNTTSLQEDNLRNTCATDGEGSNRHGTVSAGGENGSESSEGTAYGVRGFANYGTESQSDVVPNETCFALGGQDTEHSCSLMNTVPISPRDCYNSVMAANDTLHSDSLLHETENVYLTKEEDEKSVLEHALELTDMKYESILETGAFAEEGVHTDHQNATGTSTSNHTESRNVVLLTQGYSLEPGYFHTGDTSEQSDYVTWQGLESTLDDSQIVTSSESQLPETESNTNEIQPIKEEGTAIGIWGKSPSSLLNPLFLSEDTITDDEREIIEKSNQYALEIMTAAVQEITQEQLNVALPSELPTEIEEAVSEAQETYITRVPDPQAEESCRSDAKDQPAFDSSTADTDEELKKDVMSNPQVQLETTELYMDHILPKQPSECPAIASEESTVLGVWGETVTSAYIPSSKELLFSEEVISDDDQVLTEESTKPFTEMSYAVETMPAWEEETSQEQLNVTLPSALPTERQEMVSQTQETFITRVPDSQSEDSSRSDMNDQPEFDSLTADSDEQLQKDVMNSSQVQLETSELHMNHILPEQPSECPAIASEESTVLEVWGETVRSAYIPSSKELLFSEEVISDDDQVLTEESTKPLTEISYEYAQETMPAWEEETSQEQLNVTLPSALPTEKQDMLSQTQETFITRVLDSQSEESSRRDVNDQPEFDSLTAESDEQLLKDVMNSSQVQLETTELHMNHILPRQETECPATANEEVFKFGMFVKQSTNQEPIWESPTKANDSIDINTSPNGTEHLAYVCQKSCHAPSAKDYDLPDSIRHDNVHPSITALSSKLSVDMYVPDNIQSSTTTPSSKSSADLYGHDNIQSSTTTPSSKSSADLYGHDNIQSSTTTPSSKSSADLYGHDNIQSSTTTPSSKSSADMYDPDNIQSSTTTPSSKSSADLYGHDNIQSSTTTPSSKSSADLYGHDNIQSSTTTPSSKSSADMYDPDNIQSSTTTPSSKSSADLYEHDNIQFSTTTPSSISSEDLYEHNTQLQFSTATPSSKSIVNVYENDNIKSSTMMPSSTSSADMYENDKIQSACTAPSSTSSADLCDCSGNSQIASNGDSFPFHIIPSSDTFCVTEMNESLLPICDTGAIDVDTYFNEQGTIPEISSGPVILISEAVEERYEISYAEEPMASETTHTSPAEEQQDSCQPLNFEALSTSQKEALPNDSVILKRVSYKVFCVLIFVILTVIIYQCDLMVCFVLYLFSLYWLCWERGTNKESVKKD